MHVATYKAFKEELEKISFHSLIDAAALGTLAAPTIQEMRGKKVSDRTKHVSEVAGLGAMGASATHKIYTEAQKHMAEHGGGLAKAVWHGLKHANAGYTQSALRVFEKDAGLMSRLLGKAEPELAAATKKFVPSFKGHGNAVANLKAGKVGETVRQGVHTNVGYNPLTQSATKTRYAEL